jgi:uncharacterized repeat protein (TIGR03803 family)
MKILTFPFHLWMILLLIPLFNLFFNSSALSQCTELYGTLCYGGISDAGALFKTDENGENLTYVYSPELVVKGSSPRGDLCQASNGKLYGLTMSGGVNDVGVIFELDTETGEYTNKFGFSQDNGANPMGSLIQAKNGKLYGMTCYGGANNCGVIFEWDPATNIYTKKFDLNKTNGSNPSGSLIQAEDSSLYGLTGSGGKYDMGVLFEWDPNSGKYTKWIDFQGNINGKGPHGSLILADNNKLYGMTSSGGSNDAGVIFEFDPSTMTYIKKIDFGRDARNPDGSLFQALNGKFYGMTPYGGYNDQGVLFEWDLSSNTINQKILFIDTNGNYPVGSLIQTDNGLLYGMTSMGGINNSGVLFEFDPVAGHYIKKHDFEENIHYKERMVYGSLCKAKNGRLYGMTACGGPDGNGKVFEFEPVTGTHKDMVSFYNKENGAYPIGSLVQAKNGKLYGINSYGGANNMGTIYEWDPREKTYSNKVNFNGTEIGRMPEESMIRASNNKFYGMTMAGGSFNYGTLFEYVPETNSILKLHDFNTESGIFPTGSMIQADNGKLYGTCATGGKYRHGVIFEWDPSTSKFAIRFDFPYVYRSEAHCAFIRASNGKLYGIRDNMLFEWDPADGSFVKKFDFNRERDGEAVFGPMVKAGDGMYYGMTEVGGSHDVGVLFKWNPETNIYSKLLDFDGAAHGGYPYGSLFKSRNGKLYGMTTAGGTFDGGVLFEWDYINGIFTKKMDFNPATGSRPLYGSLVEYGFRSTSVTLDITACDKYNFSGKTITESGTYYDTIPNAAGCDSLITLNLTVLKSTLNTLFETACSEYNFNGRLLKTSGTYFDKIPNVAGCDSITVLFLTIVQPTSSNLIITTCNEFQFGDKVITKSGVYVDTIPNSVGCDSVITLHLMITHQTEATLVVSACDSYTSPGGRTWITSGTYTDTIPNAEGCDSIITIFLSLPHRSEATINATACNAYLSPSGRYTWTADGTYVDNIQNEAGCDSIITVHLSIIKSTTVTIHPVVCNSYTSPSGLYTWNSSGTYSDLISNAAGCDSLLTINLQVDYVDTSVIQDRSVLISKDRSANHQWISCDEGNAPIDGETFLTYTAHRNGHFAVIVSQGVCVDTSAVFEVLVTGITEPSENQITLYPNPTPGNFTIDLGRVYTAAMVTITRYDGQVIRKVNVLNSRKIDLDLDLDAPSGIYLVTILDDDREVVLKVVKE